MTHWQLYSVEYLGELLASVPTSANVTLCAEIVHEKAVLSKAYQGNRTGYKRVLHGQPAVRGYSRRTPKKACLM